MDTPIRLIIGTYFYTWCPSFEISKHHNSLQVGISVFLAWTPLVLRKNRFLTLILSFNFQCRWNVFWNNNLWCLFCHGSSAWRSAFHPFQALADALSINKSLTRLDLYQNQIGENGMKVWWVERCGASRGSCVRVDGSGLRSVEHQWKWWEVTGFDQRLCCWALNLLRI